MLIAGTVSICWDSQSRKYGQLQDDQGLMGAEGRVCNLSVESRKVFQEAATVKLQFYGNECLEEEQHLGRKRIL